ncbi:amiloride-sensitive sodium channel domain-containing protein [Ditylenchus destructor]|nr:amiloride-sensitive sodium channel domain-containing protein [Ditylenchus destructor]
MEIKESTRYQLFDLLVNLGSTLGLYFGMTVLTLFELAIFVFYRDESKIKMQRVPDQSVIYDLPRNAKKTSQMVHQRKTKNNIQGLYKNEANSIMPTIF